MDYAGFRSLLSEEYRADFTSLADFLPALTLEEELPALVRWASLPEGGPWCCEPD